MSEQIVSVDQEAIKSELRKLVKTTVEQTINALLDEEADQLVGAERYERTAKRDAYRSGHYGRKLVTTSGEIELKYRNCVVPHSRPRSSSVTVVVRQASRRL